MKHRISILVMSVTALLGLFTFITQTAQAANVYEVGPGKPYVNVGDVPWESLQAVREQAAQASRRSRPSARMSTLS
jgi:hypothetical protein